MKIACSIALALLFFQCTVHQYATVEGDLPKKEVGHFEYEDDSVKIRYSFSGHNGPVRIEVVNKLDHPIYIDWSKSALILGEQSTSYHNTNSTVKTHTTTTEIDWTRSVSTSSGNTGGVIYNDAVTSFIPPHSAAGDAQASLTDSFVSVYKGMHSRRQLNTITGYAFQADSYVFEYANSPIQFKSFLTLYFSESSHPKHYTHSFWISEVVKSNQKPKSVPLRPNQFYT